MRFGLKEVIFLLVLVAVPTVSVFYVFKPNQENIAKQLAEIERKRGELDQLDRISKDIDDIGRAIEEGQQLIDIIHRKLPMEQNVDQMLQQIWPLTVGNGLTVKGITTEKTKRDGPYHELPLGVKVEGDFDGFYKFLLELENIDRITRVLDMKIERRNRSSADDEGGMMKAEFVLSIFYEPSNDIVASAEGIN